MTMQSEKRDVEDAVTGRRAHFTRNVLLLSLKPDPVRRSSSQIVSMMQACHSACWRFFIKAKMRPVVVVVAYVFGHQSFQMPFIQYDHMIQ